LAQPRNVRFTFVTASPRVTFSDLGATLLAGCPPSSKPPIFPDPEGTHAMIRRLIALTLLFASPVMAQDAAVNAAQADGTVGEQADGYLGLHGAPSPDVRALSSRSTASVARSTPTWRRKRA